MTIYSTPEQVIITLLAIHNNCLLFPDNVPKAVIIMVDIYLGLSLLFRNGAHKKEKFCDNDDERIDYSCRLTHLPHFFLLVTINFIIQYMRFRNLFCIKEILLVNLSNKTDLWYISLCLMQCVGYTAYCWYTNWYILWSV